MYDDRRGRNPLRAAAGLSLLATLAIGVGACGGGGTTKAKAASAAVTDTAAAVTAAAPQAVTSAPSPAQPAATHAAAPATATATTKKPAAKAVPQAVTPAPTVVTAPAPTHAALPARRHPSTAEINSIISGVHALVPLFTPTAAQITSAGDQVCTAFDQGKTVAQVKATAMQMAGVYAALVPANVADTALRTIVTTFCPGYTSKLG